MTFTVKTSCTQQQECWAVMQKSTLTVTLHLHVSNDPQQHKDSNYNKQ